MTGFKPHDLSGLPYVHVLIYPARIIYIYCIYMLINLWSYPHLVAWIVDESKTLSRSVCVNIGYPEIW